MMSIDFYRKLSQVFGMMAIGVVFGLMGFTSLLEVKDLDLWLHMRAGEYIWTHGFVPSVDVLSASAAGMPWNNHEWLFQVVVYLVKSSWGTDGLLYMQSGLVLLTCMILLFLTYHRDRQVGIVGLMSLLLFVFQTRFTVRPDLFSLLFFTLFIYVISSRLTERWALPALVVIQVLWTNSHGYFFLGIIVVVMGIAAEFLRRRVPLPAEWSQAGRLSDEEYRRMKWALLLVILAACVNPQGIKGALYPLNILHAISGDSKVFFQSITELQRPITLANLSDMNDNWPFRLMIFLSAITFFFNRRRIDLSALFVWIFFLVFALLAVRNMVYFAFAAYLVTLLNCSNLSFTRIFPFKTDDERFVQITGITVKILMIVWLVNHGSELSVRGYYDFDKYERKSSYLGIDLRVFPNKAADFLKTNGIKGRFLNDFNSGAYLIGRVYPDILVYIDGRTELRGPKFFSRYEKIWGSGDEELFDNDMARFKLTGVFVNTSDIYPPEKLFKMLAKRKDYKVIYFDYDATIFLKDIPENAKYIEKFGMDLSQWKTKKLDLKRFGPANATPYQNVSRAYALFSMGYYDQALSEANAALEVDPRYYLAHKIKGRIYEERKDWENMFRSFRLAASSEPSDLRLRAKLAIAYMNLNELDYALKEADGIIERAPMEANGYFVKAKVLVKKKQYAEAYDIVLQALSLKGELIGVIDVGDVAFGDKAFVQAEKLYALAVSKDAKDAEAHKKHGDALQELGQTPRALKEWEISLGLKADNELKKKLEALKASQKEK